MTTTRPVHAPGGSLPTAGDVPLLLSVPEAARLLGVGVSFGWMLVHSGEVPRVRLGRRVLVPRIALERLVCAASGNGDGPSVPSAGTYPHLSPGQEAAAHPWHEHQEAADRDA